MISVDDLQRELVEEIAADGMLLLAYLETEPVGWDAETADKILGGLRTNVNLLVGIRQVLLNKEGKA